MQLIAGNFTMRWMALRRAAQRGAALDVAQLVVDRRSGGALWPPPPTSYNGDLSALNYAY